MVFLEGFAYSTGEFPKIRGTLFWGPYNNDLLFRVLY